MNFLSLPWPWQCPWNWHWLWQLLLPQIDSPFLGNKEAILPPLTISHLNISNPSPFGSKFLSSAATKNERKNLIMISFRSNEALVLGLRILIHIHIRIRTRRHIRSRDGVSVSLSSCQRVAVFSATPPPTFPPTSPGPTSWAHVFHGCPAIAAMGLCPASCKPKHNEKYSRNNIKMFLRIFLRYSYWENFQNIVGKCC